MSSVAISARRRAAGVPRGSRALVYALLAVGSLIFLFPFVWLILLMQGTMRRGTLD